MNSKLTPAELTLSESEQIRRGQLLASVLGLKLAKDSHRKQFNPPRYHTGFGTKTALGLFATAHRILSEGQ